jgi:hypothetical protein
MAEDASWGNRCVWLHGIGVLRTMCGYKAARLGRLGKFGGSEVFERLKRWAGWNMRALPNEGGFDDVHSGPVTKCRLMADLVDDSALYCGTGVVCCSLSLCLPHTFFGQLELGKNLATSL